MASDVRKAMVRSAVTLFRERGIAGTSLADIIEHSGAPRGSIYHHFPGGKNQIAAEATAWAGELMNRMIGKFGDDPIALTHALFEFWRGELTKNFQTSCPIVAAALGAAESAGAYQAAGDVFGKWTRTIADSLVKRGVSAERAASAATLLISASAGATVLARAQQHTQALDQVEREMTRMLGHLLVDSA
ncbi:TetR/AcrR family transcriptional regulator [Kibdelosporangium philippinense]|uniref:TetR/AcrR family transcriptional regulator n=1 Tax=Kibdelosporangium philippinense TaxID=211113 RepID=A0ABS8ZN35_9PSEU|nr:TetR/AcrR family transcriptional regulator [Kibdelosporangium philippinense]MCE7009173.1 TetR/AcrR family transcriptional regulator [Kibdelosporangium philippinense]